MYRFFLLFFSLLSTLAASEQILPFVEKYPEILWLADANVRKTEEGVEGGDSYSEQLFGQKFVEFDRTIMTLHCLHLLLDGSDQAYDIFTGAQPENEKLLKNSYLSLHFEGLSLLKSGWGGLSEADMLQAMETALVLADMGKSDKARKLLTPFGINTPDHDDFYGQVMKIAPEVCPSFNRLPAEAKKLLKKTAHLAHYGHIFHLEGGPSTFTYLRESRLASEDPVALAFDLFVHTCDVAGALGHVNNRSSLSYKEKTHQAMKGVERAVWKLSDPQIGESDAYNDYLSFLAAWLGLDPTNRVDRVLTRVGAMLRLYTLEEGQILKEAISHLDPAHLDLIIDQLDLQKTEALLRTPTYMPVVLLNLSKTLNLSESIKIGLPFIARVLAQHQKAIKEGFSDPTIPLNFNKMGQVAKNHPADFEGPFYIDSEGNVLLGCPVN